MTAATLATIAAWCLGGAALGAVHMHLIARTVTSIGTAMSTTAAAGWLLLRFGLSAAVLLLAARQGAGPLLSMLAGFVLSRTIALRRVRGR